MDGLKANKTDWTRYDGESGVQAVLLARDLGLRVDKYLDSLAQAVELVSDGHYDAMADSMDVIRDHLLFIATTTARLITGWKVRPSAHDLLLLLLLMLLAHRRAIAGRQGRTAGDGRDGGVHAGEGEGPLPPSRRPRTRPRQASPQPNP